MADTTPCRPLTRQQKVDVFFDLFVLPVAIWSLISMARQAVLANRAASR